MSEKFNIVYVTVGTTKFDELIQEVLCDKSLNILKQRGCKKLVLQIGRGKPVNAENISATYGIDVEQYDFKFEPIRQDILRADLVIGHAGAGTCMDILNHKRCGILVINEQLMNNHQMELAQQLASEGFIYYCNVSDLTNLLETIEPKELKPYKSTGNMSKLIAYLDAFLDK